MHQGTGWCAVLSEKQRQTLRHARSYFVNHTWLVSSTPLRTTPASEFCCQALRIYLYTPAAPTAVPVASCTNGNAPAGHAQPVDGPETPNAGAQVALSKGDFVHGYVKSAQASGKRAGVFITLSSRQTARVQLRMLADEFVDDPVAAFPEGKHVSGRVVEVAGERVEMSLKTVQTGTGTWQTLNSLEVGQVRLLCCCVVLASAFNAPSFLRVVCAGQ